MQLTGKLIAVAAATMVVSAPVSAACWSNDAVQAAYVRDFDTSLMVATLRCRAKGVELTADYNKFVREKRAVLTAANEDLRAHFSQGVSKRAGLNAYDRFATALANKYGAGTDRYGCSDYAAMMQAAISAPAKRSALVALATNAGIKPSLTTEVCNKQVALAQ